MIKKISIAGSIALTLVACGQKTETPETQWLSIDNEAAETLDLELPYLTSKVSQNKDFSIFAVKTEDLPAISGMMHKKHNRCGGFFSFDKEETAQGFLFEQDFVKKNPVKTYNYTIDSQDSVRPAIAKVDPSRLLDNINHLASYHNRYYTAQTGTDSQNWVKDTWQELASGRDDFSIELYHHNSWPQPSVIATIEGTEKPNEIVVIGAHGDSISGWYNRKAARAPGADDNASGISVVTEVIKILSDVNYKPKRTIKFMSYAAEEVGLKGSREIAADYKRQGKNVVAALQLDMTGFIGRSGNIGVIRDHTDNSLSSFVTDLFEEYLPNVPVVDARCGYACSDHASWDANGFPAAFPIEGQSISDSNGNIHTPRDTVENLDYSGSHSAKFAKLAIAFAMETAK